MVALLRGAGYEVVARPEDADVHILNSCTITHAADVDARRAVRRIKRANPELKVLVTGCWAQAEPEAVAALPGVDAVLGNGDKDRIVARLQDLAQGRSTPGSVGPVGPRLVQLRAAVPMTRGRALLKVQDGCNYRCSFCIVPRVRGASRSVPPDAVLEQLQGLVDAGAPEVVLTGVHLGTWGRDLRPRWRLFELVQHLLPHLGPARLRLSSIDPHEVDDALIDLMAAHPRQICRHLHLPVQSGDPRVLRAMRRGHTVEDFAELVQRVVAAVPGIGIGTDVIVGFPTEDDAAFERTRALLAGLPLSYHHVFTYSRRRDTPAAHMPDQVPPPEKSRRCAVLRELSERQHGSFARALAGVELDGVTEPARSGGWRVLTDNYVRLRLSHPESQRRRVRVRVDDRAQCATVLAPAEPR